MKNKSEALQEKIKNLEIKISDTLKKQEQLKTELGDCLAAGEDSSKLLKQLAEIRDTIEGSVAGIRALDIALENTMNEEHVSLSEALDAETHRKYEVALKTAVKALQPLEKAFKDIITPQALPKLIEDIIEVVKQQTWTVLDNAASEVYSKTVPPLGKKVYRNELGQRVDAPLAM